MVLCGTLFACFGGSGRGATKDDISSVSQPQGKEQAHQLDEVQGGVDQKDLKKPCDAAPTTPEKPPPSKPRLCSSSSRATPQRGETEESPSAPKSLAQQDQALKAILDQARRSVQDATTATAISLTPGTSSQKPAGQGSKNEGLDAESEAQLIKGQLLALSSAFRPGPDIYVRIREQLCAAREWLQSSPSPHLAASTFMRIAGDTLLQVEASIQAAGQVPFWTPDVVAAFVELLRLYAALAHCATLMPSSSSDGPASRRKGSSKALLSVIAQLLLGRPELLGLVGQVLELLHFSEGFRRTWGVESTTTSALMLWDLVHKLVRFAASLGSAATATPSPPTSTAKHTIPAAPSTSLPQATPSKPQVQDNCTTAPSAADEGAAAKGLDEGAEDVSVSKSGAGDIAVPKSGAALKSLAALLQPGKGVAARLLAQPFERGGASGAAGHLAALRLLNQAVGAWGARLMEPPSMATHYVSQHQARFMHYYKCSEGDAESAAAELCRMHLKVLNVLVCTESPQVRMAMLQSQTAVALLQEFSLEAGVLCLEQQAEEEEEEAAAEVEAAAEAEASAKTGSKKPGNPGEGPEHAGSADEVSHSDGSNSFSSCSDSCSSEDDEGGEGGAVGERGGHGKRVSKEGGPTAVTPPSAVPAPTTVASGAAAAAATEPGQHAQRQGWATRRELFSHGEHAVSQSEVSQGALLAGVTEVKPLSLPPRPPLTDAASTQLPHTNSSSRSHRRSNSSSSRRGRGSSRDGDVSQPCGSSRGSMTHATDAAELQGSQGEASGNWGEGGGGRGAAAGKAGPAAFAFTYDLEEDFERLMALEDALGRPVELEGLEYDEEAQALLARGLTESPPCPPIPETPAIEAEEVAGAAQSRHISKAGNPPLSKEASASGSQQDLLSTPPLSKEASTLGIQQNLLLSKPPLSKEASTLSNQHDLLSNPLLSKEASAANLIQQSRASEAGNVFAASPPSFSVPTLAIPCRAGTTPPPAADHQRTPAPPVPPLYPHSSPEPGPYAADITYARDPPSHTSHLAHQSPPEMCTNCTSVQPPPHPSPGLSSQVSPGGIHMSPNSQAEWNQSSQPMPSPHSHPQPHLAQPLGSPSLNSHPPEASLSQPSQPGAEELRQPPLWHGTAKPNNQHHQSHQQHHQDQQDQHQQQPSSTVSLTEASSHLPSSVLPPAHVMPGLKGLKLGKGSYTWGEGHDTEEASSDEEGASSLPDSSYPASPVIGNHGTAGGQKSLARVSFDTPTSPSACVATAGHGAGDWEDLRRPSVPRLSFRTLRTPNASRLSTSLNANGSPSASKPASIAGSARHSALSFSRPGSRGSHLHPNGNSLKTRSSVTSGVSFDRKTSAQVHTNGEGRGHASLDLTLPRRKSNNSGHAVPSTVPSPPISNRLHHSHISPLSARDPPPPTQAHLRPRPSEQSQPSERQHRLSRLHSSHGPNHSHTNASSTRSLSSAGDTAPHDGPTSANSINSHHLGGQSNGDTCASASSTKSHHIGGQSSRKVAEAAPSAACATPGSGKSTGDMEGGGGTTERRISFPPQLPPLPLSARSLRNGADGMPIKIPGNVRPGAALQQLSARSAGIPLSPLRSPSRPWEGRPPQAPTAGGPPSMPKVPSLNLEKAVATQHPSSSRRGLLTPSGTDYARRGAGTDSSRASKGLVHGSNSSCRSTPRLSKAGQQPRVASAGMDVEGASCTGGTDDDEDGQDPAPLSYHVLVSSKLWFNDRALHSAMLQLLLRLLVTPQGALDTAYIQAVPACEDASLPPVEHLMSWHFAGPPGAAILADVARSLTRSLIQATSSSDRQDGHTSKGDKSIRDAKKESGGKSGHNQASQLRSMLLLLRLLTRQAMDCSRYGDLHFHSRGAYGNIYSARQRQQPGAEGAEGGLPAEVMVKVIEMPASGERCVLPEVFGEVAIMARFALQPLPPLPGAEEAEAEAQASIDARVRGSRVTGNSSTSGGAEQGGAAEAQLGGSQLESQQQPKQHLQRRGGWGMAKGNPGVCQLLDVGLVPDAYWIVMPKYRCSLAQWRASHGQEPPGQPRAAALYLAVLSQVVETLQVLAADSIVHYDLKAANVLVDLLPGATDDQLYSGPPAPPCLPCFQPVLADFGEARAYDSIGEAFTARNRGTEVYKSPEMLLMHAGGPPVRSSAFSGAASPASSMTPAKMVAARAVTGRSSMDMRSTRAGLASDVWSFGCLAYELLSGSMLFGGLDYASVTHRVAFGPGANLKLTAQERAALGKDIHRTDRASAADTSAPAAGTPTPAAATACGDADADAVCSSSNAQQRGSHEGISCEAGGGEMVGSVGLGRQLGDFVEWVLARDPASRPTWEQVLARLRQLREHALLLC